MIRVNGKKLHGEIASIPSKSYAHRAIIAAALSDKPAKIIFNGTSDDIEVTINCLRELGSEITRPELGYIVVNPIVKRTETPVVDVWESGSTFRFLLPVASSIYEKCRFIGRGRLPDRPIIDLINVMKNAGVSFDSDKLPFTTSGRLHAGSYTLPGDVSSQYVSGLLLSSPLHSFSSDIVLESELESKPYVDMTIEVLSEFGIEVEQGENSYHIESQKYLATDYKVEGDWSNAAFFLAAGAFGEGITITGLNINSVQGDRQIIDVLKSFNINIYLTEDKVVVMNSEIRASEVDLKEIPDTLPILAVIAAAAKSGVSRFYNGKRLRLKESDRLSSVAKIILDLGGRVEEKEDELLVYGTAGLTGGKTSSEGDHRLVMAASIASMICKEDVIIENPRAVTKSYPKFFEDFKSLGGEIIDGEFRF